MVALIAAVLLLVALLALLVPVSKRRPVGTPLTWGEAMVAGVYTYFLAFWSYAMIPHLFITWTSNDLGWRPDKLLFGPGAVLKPQVHGGWFPWIINYQTLRDILVVVIYVIFLATQVALWAWWQGRGKRAAAAAPAVVESEYGRPLVRKG